MSELSAVILSSVGSTLGSSLFEQLHTDQILSKMRYKLRKMMLPKCKCVIIDDYSLTKLDLKDSEQKTVLLSPERILSLILNDSDRSNLKNLKISSYDTYLLVVYKKLKKILNSMRFLYKKSNFIIFVSSYSLAKQLHFDDKNIHSYQMCDELHAIIVSKSFDSKEVAYFNYMRDSQKLNKCETFESFKQLNNFVIGLSNNQLKYHPSGEIVKNTEDD